MAPTCAVSPGERVARTFANPLNLSYRFQTTPPSRREAADPTVVLYRDRYYLFASKSGGYYGSKDLLDWRLVTSADLPLEDYAPTAVVIGAWLYFMASAPTPKIYRTQDPDSGT